MTWLRRRSRGVGSDGPPAPWVVRESTRLPGDFFFYNTKTRRSQWTLPRWAKEGETLKGGKGESEEGRTAKGPTAVEALRSRMVRRIGKYTAAAVATAAAESKSRRISL